ncbi:uncharacterized protein TrAtP1_010451 [Trichoderma atroviride]|uniref:uncharacterized protein n=1 Tax=Hypocrea atroviridis TaxID=63577 RepID=UPI00331EF946|nr:hypothetical protein TrAtP1_010451 [Trichoderma atroviride]
MESATSTVKIRESVVSLCGNAACNESATASNTPSNLQLSSTPFTASGEGVYAFRADLSDRLGTKGVYLAICPSTAAQCTRRVVALTCGMW